MRYLIFLLFLGVLPGLAGAQDISGRARAIDGDTIELAGQTVRLHGIDAPELGQDCEGRDRGRWPCGGWSRDVLSSLLAGGDLRCAGRGRDRYGRILATCRLGRTDIGEEMVARGAAHAYRRYSLDYVDAEKRAFVAAIGIWQGDHLPPEAFRAGTPPPEQARPAAGCAIKGNVSKSGKIYHLPGQSDYEATRIDPRRGERWFCSEEEARAAGWRAARR